MTGEPSGDRIGAWYYERIKLMSPVERVEAVGGDFLKAAGVPLYDQIENYSFMGIIEILRHLPFIFRALSRISSYIIDQKFDTVVLVDFPGFNLRLLTRLKKRAPHLRIVYVSPPQLWAWHESRITLLKNLCDTLVVMYPFEVAWYRERGVEVVYCGSPVAERVQPYLGLVATKTHSIAILPGSRVSEVRRLLPIMMAAVFRFNQRYPQVACVLMLSESISRGMVEQLLNEHGLQEFGKRITCVQDEQAKMSALAQCCCAVTKAGTNTLELALFEVSAVVTYAMNSITYQIARMLATVPFIALPNIFAGKLIYPELIQGRCTSDAIYEALIQKYESFVHHDEQHRQTLYELRKLKETFFNAPQ